MTTLPPPWFCNLRLAIVGCGVGAALLATAPTRAAGVWFVIVGLLIFARYYGYQISWDGDVLTYRNFFITRRLNLSAIRRYTVERRRADVLCIYTSATGAPSMQFCFSTLYSGNGALLLERVRQGYRRRQVDHARERKQQRKGLSRLKQQRSGRPYG